MKSIRLTAAGLAICLLTFLSCSKTELSSPRPTGTSSGISSFVVTENGICGEPVTYNLITCKGNILGTITISNNEENLFVKFTTTGAFKLSKAYLVIGDLTHLTAATDCTAWPKIGPGPNPPDYSQTFKPEVTEYTFTIPLANLPDCFLINAFAKLIKRDAYNKVVAHDFVLIQSLNKICKKWSTYIEYCKQECPPPPDCGQHRTQTQGGWGAVPNGNNPGQYLADHFAGAFPSGVTIGCAGGFTLKMNSASAIEAYLPTGSTADVLDQNWVNDGPDNVLAGQVLTLALNLGFDLSDANFSPSNVWLGDMIIVSGTFAGKTVAEFLDIANDVLGGCSNAYTPSQVNDEATAINENFDDGTTDKGHLECPENEPPE